MDLNERFAEIKRRQDERRVKEAQQKLEAEKRHTLNVRVTSGKPSPAAATTTYTGPRGFLLRLLNRTIHPLQFIFRTIGPDNRPTSEEKHLLVPPKGESPTLGACRCECVEVWIPREFLKAHRVFAGGLSFSETLHVENKLGIPNLTDVMIAKQAKEGN